VKKSYYIETYGCSLNRSDSEYMESRLREADFSPADDPLLADIVILNSCTVKDRTFLEFQKRITFYEDLCRTREKKGNPLILIVAGCIPAASPGEPVIQPYPLVGPDAIAEIAEVATAALFGKRLKRIRPLHHAPRLYIPHVRRNPVIEILPIAGGCLGRCSYCQTRLARGALVSYPPNQIERQIRSGLEQGVREVWLTAQDTGAWGLDRGLSLPDLLHQILKIPGEYRIRLGMANPNHVSRFPDSFFDLFSDERLFKFMHLPLQSGSDVILKMMNRLYTSGEYIRICERIYKQYPDFSISTDVIVGFPGEEEEDFQQTLDVLNHIKPSVVNRSKFSPRPGTPAAKLPRLHSRVVSQRSKRLTRLVEHLSLKKNQDFLGKTGVVLIDEKKKKGSVVSRNEYYKPVIIPLKKTLGGGGSRLEPGNFCTVKIVESKTFHLIGNPEKPHKKT